MTDVPGETPPKEKAGWPWLAILLVFIAFFANMGAVVAVMTSSNSANTRQDQATARLDAAFTAFETSRTQSRGTACDDANDIRVAHNRLALDLAGFDPSTGQPTEGWLALPAERQAELRPRLERNLLQLRICTDEQIERFYATNRREGFAPIDGTDADYAEAVTPP